MYRRKMCFFFQAENGIRCLVRSRGLGDVYKRQDEGRTLYDFLDKCVHCPSNVVQYTVLPADRQPMPCLLYTSDAADDLLCVDLGGRRIIKKKTNLDQRYSPSTATQQ